LDDPSILLSGFDLLKVIRRERRIHTPWVEHVGAVEKDLEVTIEHITGQSLHDEALASLHPSTASINLTS